MKKLQENDNIQGNMLEITKRNDTLTSKTLEVFRLRNHNKKLVTKIKKLKISRKTKHFNEDFEGKNLEKQEENHGREILMKN